ncbi:PnbA Carboxylesterase type B [Pyrenophora tritici-repentis]|nr:PnbA Carboxylesterase type B [Pyrenophora tritici-repentis]
MHYLLPTAAAVTSLFGPAVAVTTNRFSVHTSSGTLIGHPSSNRTYVTEFLGIRYAEAPVGELRFAAPKKYHAPAGTVFEASNWSSDCPAVKPPVSAFPNFTEPSGLRVWKNFAAQNNNSVSEDCLKLNVWTTDTGESDAKKPVLVFLHGGRFQIPGPHSPFYNGQYLADAEDVVVVTLKYGHYRLGIFGFPGAPGIEKNAALRDHRTAVEWVRDNIAGFGGDASRIVIYGQSAGAAAVDYWAYAWKNDPVVSGLISMSGTSLSFIPNTAKYSQSIWYNVSQTIGCGGAEDDPGAIIACVRAANMSALLAASAKVPGLPSGALTQATFHPTVDNITVFADYEKLSESGSFAKIPFLSGNADHEDGWYRISGWATKLNFTNTQWELFTQRAFTCPTAHSVGYRVKHEVPTWRYRYHGEWDNLLLYNSSAGLGPRGSAAYHGSDLGLVFGTAQDISGLPNSPAENKYMKYIQGAWAAFARDSQKGLTQYGWPEYKSGNATLVELAYNNNLPTQFVDPWIYDKPCPVRNDPLPGRGAF